MAYRKNVKRSATHFDSLYRSIRVQNSVSHLNVVDSTGTHLGLAHTKGGGDFCMDLYSTCSLFVACFDADMSVWG